QLAVRCCPVGYPAAAGAVGDCHRRSVRPRPVRDMIRLAWPVQAGLWAIAAFVLLLLYGPLFLAIFFSFFAFKSNQIQWDSFSFAAYAKLVDNQRLLDSLTNTFIARAI